MKILLQNRPAKFNYEIVKDYEAGIVLFGTEVKSLINNQGDLTNAFAILKKNEIFILNLHIPKYKFGNIHNHEEDRTRKLLLHKREILNIGLKCKQDNLHLIPLSIYVSKRKIKVRIGLGRSRKKIDKRQVIKEREMKRDLKKY